MSTFHALYRKYDELICFGVEQAGPVRELDSQVVAPFLSAIETQMLDEGFPGDHGLSPRRVSKFDLLGHVSKDEPLLTMAGSGWSNRVVHVFPCFACELSAAWSTQRFASVMREIKVFDIARKPAPYIEIKMYGGKSGAFRASLESDLQAKWELYLATAVGGLFVATHRGIQLGVGLASDAMRPQGGPYG